MRNFNQPSLNNLTVENKNYLAWTDVSDYEIEKARKMEFENERARVVEIKDEENLAQKISGNLEETFSKNENQKSEIGEMAEFLLPNPEKIIVNSVEKIVKLTDEATKIAGGIATGAEPKKIVESSANLVAPIITPENFMKVGGEIITAELARTYNSATSIIHANRLAKIPIKRR